MRTGRGGRESLDRGARVANDRSIVYEPSRPDLGVTDVRLLDGRRVDLACAGGLITAVGPGAATDARVVHDGGGGLATRPLTEPHLHLDKAGTAGPAHAGAATLAEAIAAMRAVKRAERGDVDGVAARMTGVLARVVAGGAGSTVVRAVVDVDETWGLTGLHAALRVREAAAGACTVRVVAFPQDGLSPAVARLLEQAAAAGADVIGAHTDVDTAPAAHLRTAAAIAAAAGLPLEVHTDEGAAPDRFHLPVVLDALDRHAGLAATLVHCLSLGTLPDAEQAHWVAALAERRLPVCVAPSVLALGVPLAPVRRLIEAGVPVLVGSDNLHDVFCPLGTGRAVDNARHAALVGQLTRAELLGPLVSGITDAAWATVVGSAGGDDGQAVDHAGALVPGSPATFVVHEGATPLELLRGGEGLRLSVDTARQAPYSRSYTTGNGLDIAP
jgi:cytosine deaminase